MRLVTWNVNGIKTINQYHPWNQLSSFEAILDGLGGDIVCFQETKITTAQIDKSLACMDGYDSFFSCYRRSVKAIHGTSIHTKRSVTVPVKAEEGLSSLLLPSTTLPRDRIGSYPLSSDLDLGHEMKELDSEGRTTVCDFGLFVLINLYCPHYNLTKSTPDRLPFKENFMRLLDCRTRNFIRAGREVVLVGDLNLKHPGIDTEEMDRANKAGKFSHKSWVRWFAGMVGEGGLMIDVMRRFHPTRTENMITCDSDKSRLDYILITPGLLPWIKEVDILSTINGSDHWPVYIDFHDQLEIPGRGEVLLWDEMNPGQTRSAPLPKPPPFAARFDPKFKQKSIASFFTPAPSKNPPPSPPKRTCDSSDPDPPRKKSKS